MILGATRLVGYLSSHIQRALVAECHGFFIRNIYCYKKHFNLIKSTTQVAMINILEIFIYELHVSHAS